MREYGKIHTAMWASPTFKALSDNGRMLAIYLLTCQHQTIAGVFRCPDGYAAEDLDWSPERVRKGFEELFRCGFATRCERTKWVKVHKFLDWNPPENPNQRKAVDKCLSLLPKEVSWLNPSETVPQPLLNQEQEQEQDKEPDEANASSSSPAATKGRASVPCPYEAIVEAYHSALPMLPRVRLMDEKRRKAMRKLWAWVLSSKKQDGTPRATNGDEALAWFAAYFDRVQHNDWLTGRSPSRSHPDWKADLEFLLTDRGLKAVLERTEAAA
jgi:hypothetical protein